MASLPKAKNKKKKRELMGTAAHSRYVNCKMLFGIPSVGYGWILEKLECTSDHPVQGRKPPPYVARIPMLMIIAFHVPRTVVMDISLI
jgi:hypothetical protein